MSPSQTPHGPEQLRVTTPDGREVAAEMVGPADGFPVLFAGAAPGSRRFDPAPDTTAGSGVRLITLDRPGYGASAPLPEGGIPTITGAADDAALVLDSLGITDAGVVGWSAGGRVALAMAARRPELVRAVAVVAAPAPHEEVAWIGDDEQQMITQLSRNLDTAMPDLTAALEPMTSDRETAVGMVCGGPADEATLERGDVRERVLAMLTEAFVSGAVGVAGDIASYTLVPWGFDARAVGAPVGLWYGADDPIISPEHGRWWAHQVGGATLHVVDDAGHLVVVPAWPEILDFATKA